MAALVADVAPHIEVAPGSYAPLGVDLVYADYQLLAPLRATRTDNAQEIIDLAKEELGGARPQGIDIVCILTDLDIQLPGIGSGVAGLADCIGGVAHDDRAFAVGEYFDEIPIGPATFHKDATAKILAHEVGHLMAPTTTTRSAAPRRCSWRRPSATRLPPAAS